MLDKKPSDYDKNAKFKSMLDWRLKRLKYFKTSKKQSDSRLSKSGKKLSRGKSVSRRKENKQN